MDGQTRAYQLCDDINIESQKVRHIAVMRAVPACHGKGSIVLQPGAISFWQLSGPGASNNGSLDAFLVIRSFGQ